MTLSSEFSHPLPFSSAFDAPRSVTDINLFAHHRETLAAHLPPAWVQMLDRWNKDLQIEPRSSAIQAWLLSNCWVAFLMKYGAPLNVRVRGVTSVSGEFLLAFDQWVLPWLKDGDREPSTV